MTVSQQLCIHKSSKRTDLSSSTTPSFMQERELPPEQELPQEPSASTAPQPPRAGLPPGAILFEHASFSWDADGGDNGAGEATLLDVSLDVQPGQLVAIVGPVGAGKSTLISACLGEIPCVAGTRALHGSVSLFAQEAWVQQTSVRKGILFGRPYDRARYKAVLKATQLNTDLEQLAAGDHTEIGER